jgi:hypothetical protein
MLNLILACAAAIYLSACATTHKDFKVSDVKPTEGVVIGKVNIKYNGKDLNKDCAVCLNSVNGPCQNLTEDGLVFKNIPRGESSIRRIACKDTSLQHYNMTGANFQTGEGVTYFGQVEIEWANKGGFKASDMFGAIGAAIGESSNDGTIKMSVKDRNMNEVVKAYEDQTKEKIKPTKSIVKVGQ